MRARQKFVRLHFQKPAEGALKLELKAPARVKRLQPHIRRQNQFDVAVLELINQIDESPGHIVLAGIHLFDIGNQHCMEQLAQLDVIILAARPIA